MSLIEVDRWRPARPIDLTEKVQGYVVLMGYSVKESTGSSSAEVDIYNGQDTKGLLVCPITLSAGQSAEDWFGPQGIEMSVGVFVNIASGSVVGSVWIADHRGSNR